MVAGRHLQDGKPTPRGGRAAHRRIAAADRVGAGTLLLAAAERPERLFAKTVAALSAGRQARRAAHEAKLVAGARRWAEGSARQAAGRPEVVGALEAAHAVLAAVLRLVAAIEAVEVGPALGLRLPALDRVARPDVAAGRRGWRGHARRRRSVGAACLLARGAATGAARERLRIGAIRRWARRLGGKRGRRRHGRRGQRRHELGAARRGRDGVRRLGRGSFRIARGEDRHHPQPTAQRIGMHRHSP